MSPLRQVLLVALSFGGLAACGQHQVATVTVLLFDNQHPRAEVAVDTLLHAQRIDLSRTSVDLFFANQRFHLPYYAPTDGLLKNAAKDRECNQAIYPQTVKCYDYDSRNRVIRMSVSGSGTTITCTYHYNNKGQITEIQDNWGHITTLTYNADGTLAELTQKDSLLEKRLLFIYQ